MDKNKENTECRCYTIADLMSILGVSKPTIYNLLKKREFSWHQIGGKIYRIPKKNFDEWLENQEKYG